MRPISKLLLILLFFQLILIGNVYALELKEKLEYLIDTRGDDGDLITNRISIHKKLEAPDIDISLFNDVQWNFDTSDWEKILFGVEASKPLGEYFFIGQSLQSISGQILDYMAFDADSYSFDTTTTIGITLPFLTHYSLRVWEEYSVNLEHGRDEYTETLAKINYAPKDSYSLGLGWRHTDRIHNLDTDYVSLSIQVDF